MVGPYQRERSSGERGTSGDRLLGPGLLHRIIRAHGPAVPRRSTNKEQDCHHSGIVAPVCSRKSDPTDASRSRAAARFLTRPQAGQGFAPMPTLLPKTLKVVPDEARSDEAAKHKPRESPVGSWNREPGDDSDDQGKGSDHDDRPQRDPDCEWHALSLHVRSDQTRKPLAKSQSM
jgi:hypothetical protein